MAWDNIHLPHSAAYAQRSALLADAAVAAVSGSEPSGPGPVVPVAAGDPSTPYCSCPARVLDARSGGGFVAAGGTLTVDLTTALPAGATAAAVRT